MKIAKQFLLLAGVVVGLTFSSQRAAAQGRGNFDPEQMRVRMMERYRESLEITKDDEWKIVEGRITAVMEARRAVGGGFGGRGGFGGPPPGFGGPGGPGGAPGAAAADGPAARDNAGDNRNTNRRNRFGAEPNPEMEALQKAVEAKASNDELKSKLAKVREAQKEKRAKLEKAQEDLRQILSVRQEAAAVVAGLLQ